MKGGPIAWFATNPVAANLLMILIIMGGITSLPSIQQKAFPDVEVDVISISVPYLGAAPEEVERGVCVRIEEEIFSITGIDRVTSSSAEGACGVSAELVKDYPIDRAVSEIKNAVDAITTFPVETEKPIVQHFEIKRNALQIALYGDASEQALKLYGERVRDEIAALPGVTQVELDNARAYEMSIEVPESALRRHGLTFDQVVEAVRRSSLDMPGGAIKTKSGEILLRAMGQAYRAPEFEDIVVLTREDGTRLLLGEVANVVDGFEEDERSARFDERPAVIIKVFRVGDQKILELVETVRAYLAQVEADLPDGLAIAVWRDESEYLRDRLNVLVDNGTFGFALVFCVLALFLKLRLAFWVAIGVPISILGALFLFPVVPLAIDVLTLFAFILVLGLLVDDAIVVGENIHTHQEAAEDPLQASIQGAREVAVPVVFGVLTTVAAFFPLVFAEGTMGAFFGAIGITAICCLAFSLVESLWILPSHLGHHVKSQEKAARPGSLQARWKSLQLSASTLLTRIAKRYYRPALERVIHYRYTAAAVAVVCLGLTFTIMSIGWVKFVFFDQIESDTVRASVLMPPGTPVEVTADAVRKLETAAQTLRSELDERFADVNYPMIKHVMAAVGGAAATRGGPPSGRQTSGSNYGEVAIEMAGGDFRLVTGAEVVQRWRELAPAISGADELLFSADYMDTGAPIDVELRSVDVALLQLAAEEVKAKIATYAGVFDIADSFQEGKSEIQLKILPSAEPLGLTLDDLARQVRQAFYGAEAQRIQRGRDDIRVMVRYPESSRRSLADLDDLRIRTPKGGEVPFYVVARAEPGRGFSTIKRTDRQRVLNVTADVDLTQANANQIVADLTKNFLPQLVRDHPGLGYDFSGEQREQRKTTTGMFRDTGLALILIFALLAVPLRSYFQPLLIMAVIPFGIVGAVMGHLIMGINMSMMSAFGIVALTGVVVNSSLVLVHYINRRREQGDDLLTAVRDAGVARFRPIVLTTMTTFSGLTPLLLERSMGAQFLIPMATSLAFGVVFATSISLFLLPAGYVILDDLQKLAAGRKDEEPESGVPHAPVRSVPSVRSVAMSSVEGPGRSA